MAKRFKMPKRSRAGAKETPLDLRSVRSLFAESNRFAKDLANIAGGKIQDIAGAAAREIGRDATAEIWSILTRPNALADVGQTIAAANETLRKFADLIGRGLADSAFAAESGSAALIAGLAGGVVADDRKPPTVPPAQFVVDSGGEPLIRFPVIDEAVRSLQQSQVMPANEFYAIARESRESAFTISAEIAENDLDRVREVLERNIASDTDREKFMRDAREAVDSLTISDSHLEQVFRNNTNDRYAQGVERVLDQPLVGDQFPYRAYYAIRDDRVRDEHLELEKMGLDGTNVFYADDPVWQMFRPPWDWNCRCGFTPLSIRQAARKGVREAQQWLDTGVEPDHQFVDFPDFRPSASWLRRAS